MSDEAPFCFKVLDDKAVRADDLPKLPPRAVGDMMRLLKGTGVDPDTADLSKFPDVLNDIAITLVTATLRRIDPKVTKDALLDFEDWDEVMRCFRAIQGRNPTLFPKADPAKAEAKEDDAEDPTSARSGPAPDASAQ